MNVFRLAGDLSHLLAIIILLLKIWKTRSCAGKSKKSENYISWRILRILSILMSFCRRLRDI